MAIVGEGLILENAVKTGENYPIIYADDNASINYLISSAPLFLEVHKVYAKDKVVKIKCFSAIYASITMYAWRTKTT